MTALSSTITAQDTGPFLTLVREGSRGDYACITLTRYAEEALLELLLARAQERVDNQAVEGV